MDTSSSRSITRVNPAWGIPQLRAELAAALDLSGPALAVCDIDIQTLPDGFHETALVVATSGSTGTPKQVALSASAMRASADATHRYLGAVAGDTWSLLLPTHHIAGMNVITRAIALGSEIVDVNSKATFTAVVPTQLHRALNGDRQLFEHLQSTKAILVGGAPLTDVLKQQANDRGLTIITTYGMSESCGGCVYNREPLPGVELSIIDSRIAIKAPMLATGYLNRDEEFLSDGWFITADQGRIDSGHLFVEGRSDDVIISGGEKISLSTITDFLNVKYAPQEFMAFAFDDEEWGESLGIASTISFDQEAIKSLLKAEFGSHLSPKMWQVLDSLPKTSLGKPDPKQLRARFGRLSS